MQAAPRPYWIRSDDHGRCARGDRCADATTTIEDEGRLTAAWADMPLPFCPRDARAVSRMLYGMPGWFVELRQAIGEKPRGITDKVSGSRAAPIPVRLDVDALIRLMVVVLCSWEERLADVAQLTRPATWLSRYRRDQVSIPAAVKVIGPRVDDLLQLAVQPMIRTIPIDTKAADAAALETVRAGKLTGRAHRSAGYAEVYADMDGAAAGLEILYLDHRCRQTLGQTPPRPVVLDGVPCRNKDCEMLSLEVAPEPQYRSECGECGDLMSADEYARHTRRYATWARSQVAAGNVEPAHLDDYRKAA
jgi:hypothetical protein